MLVNIDFIICGIMILKKQRVKIRWYVRRPWCVKSQAKRRLITNQFLLFQIPHGLPLPALSQRDVCGCEKGCQWKSGWRTELRSAVHHTSRQPTPHKGSPLFSGLEAAFLRSSAAFRASSAAVARREVEAEVLEVVEDRRREVWPAVVDARVAICRRGAMISWARIKGKLRAYSQSEKSTIAKLLRRNCAQSLCEYYELCSQGVDLTSVPKSCTFKILTNPWYLVSR